MFNSNPLVALKLPLNTKIEHLIYSKDSFVDRGLFPQNRNTMG